MYSVTKPDVDMHVFEAFLINLLFEFDCSGSRIRTQEVKNAKKPQIFI